MNAGPDARVQVNNQKWYIGQTLCNIYLVMDVCASTASILNLLSISIDRCAYVLAV